MLKKDNIFKFLIISSIILIIWFPIIIIFIFSFQTNNSVVSSQWLNGNWSWTMQNYSKVIKGFGLSLGITLLIVLFEVFFSISITIFAAFGLSRLKFKGKTFFFYSIVILSLIPNVALITYQYKMTVTLGLDKNLMGNVIAIIIPSLFSFITLIVLKSGFDKIDQNFEKLCTSINIGTFKTFLLETKYIRSEIIMSAILITISSWNSYVWPNLILAGSGHQTLTMWILQVSIDPLDSVVHPEYQMAASILSTIPPLLFFAWQKNTIYKSISR